MQSLATAPAAEAAYLAIAIFATVKNQGAAPFSEENKHRGGLSLNRKQKTVNLLFDLIAFVYILMTMNVFVAEGDSVGCSVSSCTGVYQNGFCSACGGFQSCTGSGTAGDPYIISNAGNLYWFAEKVNGGEKTACAFVSDDITVNEAVLKPDGTVCEKAFRVWKPIGSSSKNFKGKFNGNGKTVSGLYVQTKDDYVGFFGYINSSAEVESLGIEDSWIHGRYFVGGIAGFNAGKITGCFNKGSIDGYDGIGGIAGKNHGTVFRCYNTGNVAAGNETDGGIVGINANNNSGAYDIICCYNTYMLKNNDHGIVGQSVGKKPENCYYLSGSDNGRGGKTERQFSRGEVAYLLNNSKTDEGIAWFQTIGTDMLPSFSGKIVFYKASGYYNSESGDINGDGEIDIRDLVRMKKSFAAGSRASDLDLNDDKKADTNDIVVLRKILMNTI